MRTRIQRLTGLTAALVALVLLCAALVVLALAYRQQRGEVDHTRMIVHQNQRSSDKRWCTLLLSIKSPPGPKPKTPSGQHLNDAVTQLYKDFDCV